MTDVKQIEESEKEVAVSGAAPFANRFFINVGPVVRITFAEQWGPDTAPQFRVAVTMAHADVIELKNALGSLLADVERQIDEANAARHAGDANG